MLGLLDLRPRSGFRYAPEEFAPRMDALQQQVELAQAKDEKQRDPFQAKVLELYGHLQRTIELARGEVPLVIPPQDKGENWESYAVAEARASRDIQKKLDQFREMAVHTDPALSKLSNQQMAARLGPELQRFINPATRSYAALLGAYGRDDAKAFNKELTDYEKLLDKDYPSKRASRRSRHSSITLRRFISAPCCMASSSCSPASPGSAFPNRSTRPRSGSRC